MVKLLEFDSGLAYHLGFKNKATNVLPQQTNETGELLNLSFVQPICIEVIEVNVSKNKKLQSII